MTEKKNTEKKNHERPCPCSGNPFARSKGELTVICYRTSFNITQKLPYIIWGAALLQGNTFANVLQKYLPAGISVTVTISNTQGLIVFEYENTLGKKDQIIVLTPPNNTITYLDVLENLKSNYLRSELVYFNCNAQADPPLLTTDQLNDLKSNNIYLLKSGGVSSRAEDTIIPQSRMQLNNSVPNIIDISMPNQEIKQNTAWVHSWAHVLLAFGRTDALFLWNFVINEQIDMNEENIQIEN